MTWNPFELFMKPAKESEILMPSDEGDHLVYNVRPLFGNRIRVRKMGFRRQADSLRTFRAANQITTD